MERRTAIRLMAAGVATGQVRAGQHHLLTLVQAPSNYKLQFFSPVQNELLDRLTEMIIPADERSPGAREAKVNLFIDLMVAHSESSVQDQWVSGLKAVEREAQRRFGKKFLECTSQEQDQMMAEMAAEEVQPSTALGRFFVLLKSRTIDGYYTSSIGIHQELRYKGNRPQAKFLGCVHPEHGT